MTGAEVDMERGRQDTGIKDSCLIICFSCFPWTGGESRRYVHGVRKGAGVHLESRGQVTQGLVCHPRSLH